MDNILSGKKVCILVASGFAEQSFSTVQKKLLSVGATIKTIAPDNGLAHGWLDESWGHYFPVDTHIGEAMGSDYDRLIVIGGARGVEKLKANLHTRRILRHFFDSRKPMVAMEEAIELLTLCDHLNGLEVAAPALLVQTMKNAGAIVSGNDATIDGHLLTFAHLNGDDWQETIVQHLAEEPAEQQQAA